jgi:hypothetical protein
VCECGSSLEALAIECLAAGSVAAQPASTIDLLGESRTATQMPEYPWPTGPNNIKECSECCTINIFENFGGGFLRFVFFICSYDPETFFLEPSCGGGYPEGRLTNRRSVNENKESGPMPPETLAIRGNRLAIQ